MGVATLEAMGSVAAVVVGLFATQRACCSLAAEGGSVATQRAGDSPAVCSDSAGWSIVVCLNTQDF